MARWAGSYHHEHHRLMPESDTSRSVGEHTTRLERTIRTAGRRLGHRRPAVRGPLLWLWSRYVRTYATLVCWTHDRRYARRTRLRPFEVLTVDPATIDRLVDVDGYPQQTKPAATFPEAKFKYAGTVQDGDWDTGVARFEDTDVYRAFEAHFDRGVDWEKTEYFDRVVGYIEEGVDMWGCPTREAFVRRCETIDTLYASINANGYRTQRELGRDDVEDPIGSSELPWVVRFVYNELTVCIGRDGTVRFFDGRNRLAIAKLLGLETVPVWVMVRHPQWQAFREELAADPPARSRLQSELGSHPDLRSILDR